MDNCWIEIKKMINPLQTCNDRARIRITLIDSGSVGARRISIGSKSRHNIKIFCCFSGITVGQITPLDRSGLYSLASVSKKRLGMKTNCKDPPAVFLFFFLLLSSNFSQLTFEFIRIRRQEPGQDNCLSWRTLSALDRHIPVSDSVGFPHVLSCRTGASWVCYSQPKSTVSLSVYPTTSTTVQRRHRPTGIRKLNQNSSCFAKKKKNFF